MQISIFAGNVDYILIGNLCYGKAKDDSVFNTNSISKALIVEVHR